MMMTSSEGAGVFVGEEKGVDHPVVRTGVNQCPPFSRGFPPVQIKRMYGGPHEALAHGSTQRLSFRVAVEIVSFRVPQKPSVPATGCHAPPLGVLLAYTVIKKYFARHLTPGPPPVQRLPEGADAKRSAG